jgi:hypothetical protein
VGDAGACGERREDRLGVLLVKEVRLIDSIKKGQAGGERSEGAIVRELSALVWSGFERMRGLRATWIDREE